MQLFFDFIPIFVFVITYFYKDIFFATAALMVVMPIFLFAQWLATKKINKMYLASPALIIILGSATLFFRSGSIEMSGVLSVLPWVAGAGAVYSGIRYFHYRDLLNALSTEGRTLGFLSSSISSESHGWQWTPIPKGIQIAWVKNF